MKRVILTLFTFVLACAPSAAALAGTQAFDAQMKPVAKSYLVIQAALASDSMEGVKAAATDLAEAAKNPILLDPKTVSGEHAKHYVGLAGKIVAAAEAVAKAEDIAAAREAFKILSRPLAMWAGMSKPEGIYVIFCSMAKGSWLQSEAAIRNPYYGAKMLACGEVINSAPEAKPAPKRK